MLDEDGYAAAEYHDVVKKRFIKAWGNAMDGYKVRIQIQESIRQHGLILAPGHFDGDELPVLL
jgi:hypothetical protein